MLIDPGDLAVFLTASLMLNLTPGNDMMFVLGQSMRSGFGAGVAASLGIATGSAIHLLLVALGVAVLLDQHPMLFDLIRYAGVAYLLWLAWRTLASHGSLRIASAPPRSIYQAWRDGTVVNLLNPKVIVFMFAFLPPFVRPENGTPLLQLLILGLIFNTGGTAINMIVAAFAGKASQLLATNRTAATWFNRISACILLLLAARLLLDRR
jgi:threonine/homoserine/homoserine lactone efflux protein